MIIFCHAELVGITDCFARPKGYSDLGIKTSSVTGNAMHDARLENWSKEQPDEKSAENRFGYKREFAKRALQPVAANQLFCK